MWKVKAGYAREFGGDPSPPLPELCCQMQSTSASLVQ